MLFFTANNTERWREEIVLNPDKVTLRKFRENWVHTKQGQETLLMNKKGSKHELESENMIIFNFLLISCSSPMDQMGGS
jgi:hypothetical protein